MQQRRFRPGDVLDDYCPRERRITDHAIVAMIDDHIKQTRCVVCDAEHEYKEGKVPPQRRKKPQAALFTQVLDGLQGPHPARPSLQTDPDPPAGDTPDAAGLGMAVAPMIPSASNGNGSAEADSPAPMVADASTRTLPQMPATTLAASDDAATRGDSHSTEDPEQPVENSSRRDEGSVRRSLIRATLPRPEGQSVPTRAMPEFTIHQPNNGRGGHRPGGRRRGGHQHHGGGQGGARFGRGGHGQRQHGGRSHGPNGGRSRRGGKKR